MRVNISTSGNPGFGCRGYTLMEVLVAAVVLGITMVIFFAGITGGYAIINSFRQDLRATQILTQKTEAVRLCTWSQLNSLPQSFTDYYYSLGATNTTANTVYAGTISVGAATNIPSTVSYYGQVELVTIGVAWTNKFGAQPVVHRRQMQTLVAYYGLVNYLYGAGFIQQ
jgi:prepilin-type N-terminal cleavage/methylation domain-containing protein